MGGISENQIKRYVPLYVILRSQRRLQTKSWRGKLVFSPSFQYQIAVISKFPIDLIELIPSPVEWFPAQLLLLHSPIGDIQILNLHLRPPLTPGALPLPHAYVQSQYDRVTECKLYAEKINFDKPLIVCGIAFLVFFCSKIKATSMKTKVAQVRNIG